MDGLNLHDLPPEHRSRGRIVPKPNRCRFAKDQALDRVMPIRRRQHLQQVSGSSLLHERRYGANIQCSSLEQTLGHEGEILRCHVIDVRLDHNDRIHRGRLMESSLFLSVTAHHQSQAVRKILKLFCSCSISDLLDRDPAHRTKLFNNRGKNRSSRGCDQFRRGML